MLFYTHLLAGFFFALLFLDYTENKLIFILITLFFSIFADIDSSNSKIGRYWFSKVLSAFSSHRGLFHSLFFVGGFYLLFRSYLPIIALPFLIGYLTHLILDTMTVRGLRLFYPFKIRFRGFVRTGKFFEIMFFVVLLVLTTILLSVRINQSIS